MTQIRIFDPAMCCSSGVCGAQVDQTLVNFAADIAWLQQHSVQVERFNLAQQPMMFANEPQVSDLLSRYGEGCLPIIQLDQRIVLTGRYPTREELARWAGIVITKISFKSVTKSGCCGGSGCC